MLRFASLDFCPASLQPTVSCQGRGTQASLFTKTTHYVIITHYNKGDYVVFCLIIVTFLRINKTHQTDLRLTNGLTADVYG